jgi:uncharacterized protein involved in exopolysaccharide biosynthesis
MSWFSRNELSEKVSALEQENDALRADLQSAQTEAAKVPALTQEVAALNEDLESLRGELKSLTEAKQEAEEAAKPEAIEAKAIELVASAEAPETIANAISAKASEMLAAAGHPAVEASIEGDKTQGVKRAEFRKFTAAQRSEFLRNGGKITD